MVEKMTKVFFNYQIDKTKTEIDILTLRLNYFLRKLDISKDNKEIYQRIVDMIYKDLNIKYVDIERIINNYIN